VLAAGSGSQRSGGVAYISKDGGITWAKISALSGGRVLGADASQGRMHVLVRMYRPESQQDVSPIQVADTLYTSTDGDNWTVASRAPLRRNVEDLTYSYIFGSFQGVQALHVSQADPMRMFRNDGTFSRNGGQNWEPPSQGLPLNRHVATSFDVTTGINTAPARASQSPFDQHFAARLEQPRAITKGWLVGSGQMLFRSTDSGGKWDLLYEGVDWFYSSISAVGMSGDGNIVLLHLSPARVTGGPGGHYEREPAVMRSTDRGATWSSRAGAQHEGWANAVHVCGRGGQNGIRRKLAQLLLRQRL
jgi:hypothetical protein